MADHQVNNISKLSPSQAKALSMIFEECTNALAICQATLKRIPKRSTNPRVLTELERLETTDERVLNDEMKGLIRDMQEEATYKKLEKDSLYVRRIMEELSKELDERGTFDVMTKEVERIGSRRKKEEALFIEYELTNSTATNLRRNLAEEKMSNEEELTRLRNILLDLKNENESARIKCELEDRYLRAWNEAKREQNSIECEEEWKKLKRSLDDLSRRERIDERVSDELIKFFVQDIARIEEKIDEWQERYDREKKIYEIRIYEASNEIEERQRDLEGLTREYHEKQDFIDAYLVEKEELRKRREYEKHVGECAVKIQAWWRGVMVRRKLGPYRPEEKKKKRQTKAKK